MEIALILLTVIGWGVAGLLYWQRVSERRPVEADFGLPVAPGDTGNEALAAIQPVLRQADENWDRLDGEQRREVAHQTTRAVAILARSKLAAILAQASKES